MVRIYTLPLFAVRPMYLTARAFKKAFNDVILSRRAIHNMNTWYPDATEEELAATDNVCIICREEMLAPSTKKLPCNHIFHKNCLRSWFQRQQTCPTCRLDVLRAPLPGQQQRGGGGRQQQQQQREQQQQQQQQQQGGGQNRGGQAQMPNFNPIFAQFIAANARLPFPPPMAPPPQQQQPPPTASSTAGSSSTTTTSTTTSSSTTGTTSGVPPLFMPPPMFMPPFGMPPPMPPTNFSGLTEDELRAMEGTERVNVEARIRCLRNIQVLLDAAVMEMQQYSAVVSQQDLARAATSARTSATPTPGPAPTPAAASASSSTASSTTTTTTTTSTASRSASAATFSTPEETGAKPKKPAAAAASNLTSETEKKAEVGDDNSDETDEIRRRRLEKFAAANNGTTRPGGGDDS